MADNTFSYHSYAGCDITPVFNGKPIGEIQAISYSVSREKAAIYTMGSVSPRAFARGKRMIAGSLVFILFDRHPLLTNFGGSTFLADKDENLYYKVGDEAQHEQLDADGLIKEEEGGVVSKVAYVDQIPPFNIVISGANEYGSTSEMSLIGVELMNENSGFSIDDIVVEQQYSFVCREITPWQVKKNDFRVGHS